MKHLLVMATAVFAGLLFGVGGAGAAEGGDVVDVDYAATDVLEGVYVTHADGEVEAA